MIKKWVKILPYFVVVKIVKKFSPTTFKFNNKTVVGWRIDDGEWVVWNQENYNILRQKRQEEREFNEALRKEQIKEDYEREFKNER